MSKINASFTLKSDKKEVLKASQEAVDRGLEAIGMRAVGYTMRDKDAGGTPVDTGRLKNSMTWAVKDNYGGDGDGNAGLSVPFEDAPTNTMVLGTNVEYAKVIEEGGYNRKAYHMLRNALTDGADRYEKIMKANLEAANVE